MRCKLRLVTENGDKAPRESFARGVMAQVGRDPAAAKVSSLKAVCERLI
ncbi:hypothetical protein [Paraburkholderia sp. 35.1]